MGPRRRVNACSCSPQLSVPFCSHRWLIAACSLDAMELAPTDGSTRATLRIACSDSVVRVERDLLVRMSRVVQKKLETTAPTDGQESPLLAMENVTALAMHKVMEFCVAHQRRVTDTGKRIADLAQWNERFVRLDPGALCELASAAYHLEIKALVDLTCQAIAHLLKGKSPSEIRRTFNILYDFTPEDDVPPPTMRDKLRNKLITK